MEIKINVDETMFKNVLEDELNAFSKEELHDIIRECIIEALHNDNILRELFVVREKDWLGNAKYEKPTQLTLDAAKTIDLSPAYTDIQEKMINTLQTDYRSVLERAINMLIIEGITNSEGFQSSISRAITMALYQYDAQRNSDN